MILGLLGAVVSFCGGFYLFASDEEKRRRRQRGIVPVEPAEGRLCVRCGAAATVCRFNGRRWVYGASEACLYDHCRPIGAVFTATMMACERIRAGDYEPVLADSDEEARRRLIREWASPRLTPRGIDHSDLNELFAQAGRQAREPRHA